jgi:hypothetical protein
MIAWFEKHLNAAIIYHTAFAWTYSMFITFFLLEITHGTLLPGPPWFYDFSFTLNAIIDMAVFISLPVYYLILKKKNRSIWFLLFFLPSLVPIPTTTLFFFSTPFYVTGLISLLLLEKKPVGKQAVN